MGIVFKIKNANFANALELLSYPLGSGLQNLYFMENSLADSMKDKSENANNLTTTGSLEVSNHMAHFTEQASIATQMLTLPNVPSYEKGFFAIAVFAADNERPILSCIQNSGGYSGFEFSTGRFFCGVGGSGQLSLLYKFANDDNAFPESGKLRIVAVAVNGSNLKIYRYNDSGLITHLDTEMVATTNGNAMAFVPNTNSIKIGGSSVNFTQKYSMDLGMVAMYDQIPVFEDIRDICKYLKSYYTAFGFEFDEKE